MKIFGIEFLREFKKKRSDKSAKELKRAVDMVSHSFI